MTGKNWKRAKGEGLPQAFKLETLRTLLEKAENWKS
jgi:hypothetical protein